MSENFNIPKIAALTGAAQARQNIPYPVVPKPPEKRDNPYKSKVPQGTEPDNFNTGAIDDFGNVVRVNVVFPSGSYEDKNGITQKWEDITLNNIICSVSQDKIIVKTQIQGREGSVKEYIGLDDFVVAFEGAINGKNGNFPVDAVKQLETMLGSPQPVAVACWWLNNKGITTIVIQSYQLPQIKGEYSTQYFAISSLSDKPVEARINA